jgi:hypothetical protein
MHPIVLAAALLATALTTDLTAAHAAPTVAPSDHAVRTVSLAGTGVTQERICMRRCPGFD